MAIYLSSIPTKYRNMMTLASTATPSSPKIPETSMGKPIAQHRTISRNTEKTKLYKKI